MKLATAKLFTFRNRLIATAIACLLIPVFISLTVFNYIIRDTVTSEAADSAGELLKLVENNTSNQIKNLSNIANFIQVDSEMSMIMKQRVSGKVYEGADAEYKEFTDRYTIINKLDNISIIGEKVFVTVLLPNGEVFANYPSHESDPRQLYSAPWFSQLEQLIGLESLWIGGDPSPTATGRSSPYNMTLARALRSVGSGAYGYVVISINESQINQIFQRIASGREVMLVDNEQRIVSHSDSSFIGQAFTSHYVIENQEDSGLVTIEGSEYLYSEIELSAIRGWKLVSLTPYREAIAKINQTYSTVLIFLVSAFIIFLLILIYLLQKFTLPLVRLGRLAARVQEGNLDVRSHIRGTDEIGRLGASFDQMLDRIVEMIQNMTLEQKRKRRAELAMLQAQINPHFLFNVLNSIRMKVLRSGDKENADMISSLSKLMRMTIDNLNETITLHQELEVLVDYVKLMNMRQKQKVELDIQVPPETYLDQVPRFFLQPIIENAIIHGFEQKAGLIRIYATVEKNVMQLTLEDNGRGMDRERLVQLKQSLTDMRLMQERDSHSSGSLSSIGMRNVNERMRMTFGEGFTMDIQSELGKGTKVCMHIPRKEAKRSDV